MINMDKSNGFNLIETEVFKRFEFEVCALQNVDLEDLKYNEDIAFFINAYSTLAIHIDILSNDITHTKNTYLQLTKNAKYAIGGMLFSLSDIREGNLLHNSIYSSIIHHLYISINLSLLYLTHSTLWVSFVSQLD